MPLIKEKSFTIEDIYALPDGQRAELINGAMYDMTPPSRTHQRIVTELSRSIGNHIADSSSQCEVDVAPFAVFLNNDDYTYVEPDISVICDKAKLDDTGCHGAPDWIIEIVSPSSRSMDYLRKLVSYQKAGVKLYWIVDPGDRSVTVYDFVADTAGKYTFDDTVPVAICEGFTICITAETGV